MRKTDQDGKIFLLQWIFFSGNFVVAKFLKNMIHRIRQGIYQSFVVYQFKKCNISDGFKFLVSLHNSFVFLCWYLPPRVDLIVTHFR